MGKEWERSEKGVGKEWERKEKGTALWTLLIPKYAMPPLYNIFDCSPI